MFFFFFFFSFIVSALTPAQVLRPKGTILERADFPLQQLMFVTAREGQLFMIFFLSSFCQLLSPQF